MKPELRTMKWNLAFHKTIDRDDGSQVDMYLLHDPKDQSHIVSLGVPHGREDIAVFVARSIRAGQKVLAQLPAGAAFAPDLGFGGKQ